MNLKICDEVELLNDYSPFKRGHILNVTNIGYVIEVIGRISGIGMYSLIFDPDDIALYFKKHEPYIITSSGIENIILPNVINSHSCIVHLKNYTGLSSKFDFCTICDTKFNERGIYE